MRHLAIKFIVASVFSAVCFTAGAMNKPVDPRSVCEALLNLDAGQKALLQSAFPGWFGQPTAQELLDNEIEVRNFAAVPGVFPVLNPELAPLQAKVTAGIPIDKMLFVTHALDEDFENKIAESLRAEPDLQDIPRMIIASSDFRIETTALLSPAPLYQYSPGGRLSPTPVVRTAYLTGGFAFACLARTARDLIWEALVSGQREIKLVFISKLIYTDGYGESLVTTDSSMFTRPWSHPPELVAEYLKVWLLNEKEYTGKRALKLERLEGSARLVGDYVWEARFLTPAHPGFTVHVQIDTR